MPLAAAVDMAPAATNVPIVFWFQVGAPQPAKPSLHSAGGGPPACVWTIRASDTGGPGGIHCLTGNFDGYWAGPVQLDVQY
jgi:hypothetical protein